MKKMIKKIFRWAIDVLVIGLVVFTFGPYVIDLFSGNAWDTTVPDDVLSLEDDVWDRFETSTTDFQSFFENPRPLETYDFVYASNHTPVSSREVYEQSLESVVYINTLGTDGYWYTGAGSILTKDGVILTSYHVISGSDKVLVVTSDLAIYDVESVIAYDSDFDVAFLKIDAEGLSPVPLGDSDTLHVGDRTYAIGHPEDFLNTFSEGVVSGFRDYSSRGEGIQIQITNPTSSGSSGGVLLNQYGELVGIPTSSFEYDYNVVQVQNINFAVPINAALEVLKSAT